MAISVALPIDRPITSCMVVSIKLRIEVGNTRDKYCSMSVCENGKNCKIVISSIAKGKQEITMKNAACAA